MTVCCALLSSVAAAAAAAMCGDIRKTREKMRRRKNENVLGIILFFSQKNTEKNLLEKLKIVQQEKRSKMIRVDGSII